VSPQEPSRAVLARLLALVVGALILVVVPAAATAQEDDDEGSPATTSTTAETLYPTTSTNVLVTSPPPTVAPPTTVAAQSVGRRWPVDVPAGCDEPALPDVVFIGTVQDTDFRTGRFRVDQPRAGAIAEYSYQGLIDIRFGTDTKYLVAGRQYLVAAALDPATGALTSKVSEAAPLFGGDEVIGQSESDAECPVLEDPVRTLLTNGMPVDSALLRPLRDARSDVLRSLVGPLLIAIAIVFGLVVVRWIITGVGVGASTMARHAHDTPGIRRVRRTEHHR
jgi:hypothetical protein